MVHHAVQNLAHCMRVLSMTQASRIRLCALRVTQASRQQTALHQLYPEQEAGTCKRSPCDACSDFLELAMDAPVDVVTLITRLYPEGVAPWRSPCVHACHAQPTLVVAAPRAAREQEIRRPEDAPCM